jgi:hypothetical protein
VQACAPNFVGGRDAFLDARADDAGAERLGEHEQVARLRARVPHDALRMHGAGNGEPVLELAVDEGVTADDDGACRADAFARAFADADQHVEWKLAAREAHDAERDERLAAHRIHVGESIGRRDLAEDVGVVDHRRKEIDGGDEREARRQTIDTGIVAGFAADEDIRMTQRRQLGEDGAEVGRTELARASAGAHLGREADSRRGRAPGFLLNAGLRLPRSHRLVL